MTAQAAERPTRRRRSGVALVVALALLVSLGGVAAWALSRILVGPPDYPGPGTGEVVIEVQPGDYATAIGATLAAADVVKSADAFVAAAAGDDRSLGIQPGFYALRRQMSGEGALELLLDPASRVETVVPIPEGLRLDQTVDRLVEATDLPRADFEAVLERPRTLGLPRYADGNPEGYLFPATYTFAPETSAAEMLQAMVARFDQAAAELDLVARARQAGRDPGEVVTIASLVQAEVKEADFGKASRVVANRLVLGMPLQFDSTVNYVLRSSDLTLVNEQLDVDSPYNTYRYPGLPPGPINSPGEAALEAALDPPDGDWLYFVAVAPGSADTRFTADYDEFLQFKAEFYEQVP